MKKILLLLCAVAVLFACSDKEKVTAGKYGMMSDDTPQYTAVLFMRAIYNEKTLDKAIAMSEERFGRIIANHFTNSSVQRQIFNLRLDTMEVEPISGGTSLYSERQEIANIQVQINGTYNGNRVADLKTLSMVKIRGDWKVTDVKNAVP